MKKIKITVSMLLMVAILCSCSKGGQSETTVSDTQNSGGNLGTSKTNEATSTSATKSDLPYIYEDSGKAIVFNYYKDVQVIESGFAENFERAGDFSIVYNRSAKDMSLPLDKINDELLTKYAFAMNSIAGNAKQFNVDRSKEMTINGVKTLRVEGHIIFTYVGLDKEFSHYMVGYTFEQDGVVCQMIGCISDENQTQENINEMTKRVDAMMQTLRNKR